MNDDRFLEDVLKTPSRSICALVSDRKAANPATSHIIGVLEGEGIGPEVISAALHVLSALESIHHIEFDVRAGGPIGLDSESGCGKALSDEVVEFCQDVFLDGGAILAGPGGGRFVYDLRKRFDLFYKISPLKTFEELRNAGRMMPEYLRGIDILLVRENVSGVYQGQWNEALIPEVGRRAEHSFSYSEDEVGRVLRVAADIARHRRGDITVIVKDGGVPSVSKLWRDVALEVASEFDINCSFINVDYAAYLLVQRAQDLDVVVSPNLFGDVLSDVGSVLLGSRALSYSGNFSSGPAAVYQTNHGAAYDLAGTNRANPVGQIFSLSMLLRESFGLVHESFLVENAVAEVWRQGWRTSDLAESGCRLAGTREMGDMIAEALNRLINSTV